MITKVLWLWKKAKATNSKQTKHIRFSIFIKDKIDQNKTELKYCPIDEMWSQKHSRVPNSGKHGQNK